MFIVIDYNKFVKWFGELRKSMLKKS